MLFIYFKVRRQTAIRKGRSYKSTRIVSTGRRIITKISLCVTIIVLICWMPDQIISFYIGLNHETENVEHMDSITPHFEVPFSTIVIKYIFKVLLYCTAVINPIIYCFMIRSFQLRLNRMLNCKNSKTKEMLLDRRIIISSLVGPDFLHFSNLASYIQWEGKSNKSRM